MQRRRVNRPIGLLLGALLLVGIGTWVLVSDKDPRQTETFSAASSAPGAEPAALVPVSTTEADPRAAAAVPAGEARAVAEVDREVAPPITMADVFGRATVVGVTVALPDGRRAICHALIGPYVADTADIASASADGFAVQARAFGSDKMRMWALGSRTAFETEWMGSRGDPDPAGAVFRATESRIDVRVVGRADGEPLEGVECVLRMAPLPDVGALSMGYYQLRFEMGATNDAGWISIPVPEAVPAVLLSFFLDGSKIGESETIVSPYGLEPITIQFDTGPRVGYAVRVPELYGLDERQFDAAARTLSLGARDGTVQQPVSATQSTSGGHWFLAHLPGTVSADSLRMIGEAGSSAEVVALPVDRNPAVEVPIGFRPLEFAAGASYAVTLSSPGSVTALPVQDVSFRGADLRTRVQVDLKTVLAWGWDASPSPPVVGFTCPLDGLGNSQSLWFPAPGHYEWNVCPTLHDVVIEFGPQARALYSELEEPRISVQDKDWPFRWDAEVNVLPAAFGASTVLPTGRYFVLLASSVQSSPEDVILVEFEVGEGQPSDLSPITVRLP